MEQVAFEKARAERLLEEVAAARVRRHVSPW